MDIATLNQNYYNLCLTYNLNDPNIMRKFIHGLQTGDTCFSIANSLSFSAEDRKFIYAVGLLHDVGRMEQWKRYSSFSDTKGKPHEELATLVLKNQISKFFETKKQQSLAIKLIKNHTKYYFGKDKDIIKFLPVLKNADSYANLEYNATGMQRLWVNQDGITENVLYKFQNRENLHGTKIYTKLDRILQFLSRAYLIEFNLLKRDMLARKYLNAIYEEYSKFLNEPDKQILFNEVWRLKQELAAQVELHDKLKKEAIESGEKCV